LRPNSPSQIFGTEKNNVWVYYYVLTLQKCKINVRENDIQTHLQGSTYSFLPKIIICHLSKSPFEKNWENCGQSKVYVIVSPIGIPIKIKPYV